MDPLDHLDQLELKQGIDQHYVRRIVFIHKLERLRLDCAFLKIALVIVWLGLTAMAILACYRGQRIAELENMLQLVNQRIL